MSPCRIAEGDGASYRHTHFRGVRLFRSRRSAPLAFAVKALGRTSPLHQKQLSFPWSERIVPEQVRATVHQNVAKASGLAVVSRDPKARGTC